MLAHRLRSHVPLRAASPQHGWGLRVLGFFVCGVMCRCGLQAHSTVGACVCLVFSFAESCAAAGCKPTARLTPACAWFFRLRGHVPLRAASPQHGWGLRVLGFFVCGVMCRCGLQAHSTVGACVCLVFSFAGSCAAAGSSGRAAAECPEWAPHTSLGLRPWRNPREVPTRNSTL
jgi:hypothetical protein